MIRINLLPEARTAAPEGGVGVWVVSYLGVLLVAAGLGGWLYTQKQARLSELQKRNQAVEQQVQRLRRETADLEKVEAALEQSRQLQQMVEQLDRARTGPTRVLYELSRILSAGGGPTIDPERLEQLRKENPLAGFNPNWDVRRLWLRHFEEESRLCRIQGTGRTHEDIAEFMQRLQLSELFEQVALTKTNMATDRASGLELIDFELTCKVRY